MAKLVNEGENHFLEILLGTTNVDSNLYLGLYLNSTEPEETATLADITEPTGGGYTRIALARGSWTITNDVAIFAQQTFKPSGVNWGNTYGYFIANTSDNSGVLIIVEDFTDGPYSVTNKDEVKVIPQITMS